MGGSDKLQGKKASCASVKKNILKSGLLSSQPRQLSLQDQFSGLHQSAVTSETADGAEEEQQGKHLSKKLKWQCGGAVKSKATLERFQQKGGDGPRKVAGSFDSSVVTLSVDSKEDNTSLGSEILVSLFFLHDW